MKEKKPTNKKTKKLIIAKYKPKLDIYKPVEYYPGIECKMCHKKLSKIEEVCELIHRGQKWTYCKKCATKVEAHYLVEKFNQNMKKGGDKNE